MTPDEYRAALSAVGLTQQAAAKLFGAGERTARRWATGEQPIPASVELCLILMDAYGIPAGVAAMLKQNAVPLRT